jgi:hypothetical protein
VNEFFKRAAFWRSQSNVFGDRELVKGRTFTSMSGGLYGASVGSSKVNGKRSMDAARYSCLETTHSLSCRFFARHAMGVTWFLSTFTPGCRRARLIS